MKKKQLEGDVLKYLRKTVRIMRLTLFLIIVSTTITFSATSYSQNTKLTLDLNNVTVKEVIKAIEDQTEFLFFYQEERVDLNRLLTLNVTNQNMGTILDRLFFGTNNIYVINDRQIVIGVAPKKELEKQMLSLGGNVKPVIDQPQQKEITGKVIDAYELPLPGVSVIVKGTTIGTVTNKDGEFSLSTPLNAQMLQFSFVGMKMQEIPIDGRSTFTVVLEEETIGIEEVVAIGYGTMKKSDLTGSVSSVKNEELESVPVYNMEQALKAHSAGVRVTQNSGTPGSRIEVRIRGANSMIGSNDPLYVVDGFPVTGGIDFLNPSDIESVDILKDASATAIYGARGANGVVIITSKRGKTGQKGKIEINSFYGVQQEIKRYKMLDAKQYAEVANEWLRNGNLEPHFNVNQVQNPGTNWQNEIFRIAPLHNHTITFSGASQSTRYSLSGNYYDQEGIIIHSGVKRGSLRLNLDHEINNYAKVGVNINLSRRERRIVPVDNSTLGIGLLSGALSAPPTLPVYDEDGQLTRIETIYSFGSIDMRNPLIFDDPRKDKFLNNSVLGNTTLEIRLTENLNFKTLVGLEYETYGRETFSPIIFESDRGYASVGTTYRNSFLNENTLNYSKTFNNIHALNLLAGYTYQTSMNKYHSISVSGFSNNTTKNYDLASAETVNPPNSGISEWTLASWLGRANYSLNNKYIITASIRADGSSRFGAKHKWGYFPSGAVAWRASEEFFMEDVTFVSDLKLRVSYGITGNTALSPYQSLDRMSSVKYIYANGQDEVGFIPSGIANSELKWESTSQLDIGLDLNMFDNRIRLVFDYYKKNTTDLLASVPLPPSVGFGSILKNLGEIQNQGIEFSAAVDILQGGFRWDASAQISANRNKIIEIAQDSDIYGNSIGNPFWTNLNIARVGEPFGMIYGFREDGLDDEGYIKYVDTNSDDEINNLDRVIIGNPYPKFIYGLNNRLSYKNFELNIFLEGVYGNDIFWATAGTHLNSFQRGTNQFADLFGNYWTEENPDPNAKYPKISNKTSVTSSERFVKDGSYVRLKSIKLAYNFPLKKMGLPVFDRAQVYLSGTNLLTITNYPGLDPEVNTRGNDDTSVYSRLRVGIDESGYPNAKNYAIGLKLNF